MSFTKTVLSLTSETPLQATDIASKTALSIGYVRTQLRLMELSGVIERVDNRTPIFYQPATKQEVVDKERAKQIIQAKRILLAVPDESDNAIVKIVKTLPKRQWPDLAGFFEIAAMAIKELDDEGKLVDTL